MIQSQSIARELALLVLGQIPEKEGQKMKGSPIEVLMNKALQSLKDHWREKLDELAQSLDKAQQELLDSELDDNDQKAAKRVRDNLNLSLKDAETILNGLSACLEMPQLLILSDQEEVRIGAMKRVNIVIEKRNEIDSSLDSVMEGWRLKRLPRIDRDILRLAMVDLYTLKTPIAVACNEAVDLAHRYSDVQGRKMINGILRRLQNTIKIEV